MAITNVYASTLSIDDVLKQFDHSTIIEGITQLGSNITSKVNTNDKTFDIYIEGEKIISFTYGNNYIEYNNRSAVITEDNYKNDIYAYLCINSIMESIFALSGYENKTLSEEVTYTNTFEQYGIQLETESYDFGSNDESGGSSHIHHESIKYFKISLDTDKIDSLIAKYGVNIEENDSNNEVINSLTPTLEVKNITENSVTLYPSINYYNTDPDYIVGCYIYRSNDENGVYERISGIAVNCLDKTMGAIDNNLKSNTTYYYKTIVVGGTIYSSPLKVTTKSSMDDYDNNENNNYKDNINENPKTGVTFSNVTETLVLLGSIIVILYLQKKSI